jgi:hypothetical protein
MGRQYSHKHFFRHAPNALLVQYFQKHGVLGEFEFDKLKEKEVEPIFAAYTKLSIEKQSIIEADLQDIDRMACQGGATALTDEAAFHQDKDFPKALSEIEGFHGKALWAFLEHPKYWAGATLFLHSDTISDSLWKKRNDLPRIRPNVKPNDIQQLEKTISYHFYSREGRGRHCKVEVYRRYEKEYFFAYPEDYAQSAAEWVSSSLDIRAHHPAFEIIFVYSQREGSLDIYAPRNTKSVPVLQKLFAEAILKLADLDDFGGDRRVYNLDPLANRDFAFQYPVGCGIEDVVIYRMRLTLKSGKKRRISVEASPTGNSQAVYDLLDRLNPPPYYVTQVGIKVTFAPTPGTHSRIRRFTISHPNWCALRHDNRDLIIREMLADSGIELIEPDPGQDDSTT